MIKDCPAPAGGQVGEVGGVGGGGGLVLSLDLLSFGGFGRGNPVGGPAGLLLAAPPLGQLILYPAAATFDEDTLQQPLGRLGVGMLSPPASYEYLLCGTSTPYSFASRSIADNRKQTADLRRRIASLDSEITTMAGKLLLLDDSNAIKAVQRVLADKQKERDEADAALALLHDQSQNTGERLTAAVKQAIAEIQQGLQGPTTAEMRELVLEAVGPVTLTADNRLVPKEKAVGGSSDGRIMKMVAGARLAIAPRPARPLVLAFTFGPDGILDAR